MQASQCLAISLGVLHNTPFLQYDSPDWFMSNTHLGDIRSFQMQERCDSASEALPAIVGSLSRCQETVVTF